MKHIINKNFTNFLQDRKRKTVRNGMKSTRQRRFFPFVWCFFNNKSATVRDLVIEKISKLCYTWQDGKVRDLPKKDRKCIERGLAKWD